LLPAKNPVFAKERLKTSLLGYFEHLLNFWRYSEVFG